MEANSFSILGLSFLLCEKWVDDLVKERDKDKNEGRIDQLHLIRFDDIASNLSIHPSRLESPPGSLLIKESPEDWQRNVENENSK